MNKKFLIFIFAVSLLVFGRQAYASLEDLNEFKDKTLDGIENTVIQSGLPGVKKKLWDDYGLLIKPFFKFRYDLTSNVFKAPVRDTDNLWTFTPGLQWIWKNSMGVVGGAYEAAFRYFSQFSEQNHQDQKFLVYANLFPTERTYVRVSEKLDQQGPVAGSSAFEPVDYHDNTVNTVVGYKANDKLTLEFGYQNYDRHFTENIAERFNYNENTYDYRGYYQLTEKYRVWSGVRIGWVDFSRVSNRDTFY